MNGINMILFGIAALIIALCSAILWLANFSIAPYIFFVSIIMGITLCFKGLFMKK